MTQTSKSTNKKPKTAAPPEQTEKKDYKIVKIAVVIFLLVTLIVFLLWLLHGKTTVSGRYPENEKNESLECVMDSAIHPKLGTFTPLPDSSELKITTVFNGTSSVKSLGVRNLLVFSSKSDMVVAEARSHANFNQGLQRIGMGPDSFENKFSPVEEKLVFSILAKSASEITDFTKAYFMIKSEKLPTTLSEYKKEYESQGFTCVTSKDKLNQEVEKNEN